MASILFVTVMITLQLCFLVQYSNGLSDEDKIRSLPGQPPVKFQQFAGYISVEKDSRALFYYFVEAETDDPGSKPLVLWLNGGPGCSSLGAGAFSEHGPFRPRGNGLIRNDYSWNKEANMLYLESPAGVGFSYSSNKSFYNFINDEITARDNLRFLLGWLDKYQEYKGRDLFITGESYAGHYVPQLANLILQSNLKSNLKGIAIGNPLLEFNTDFNSRAEYFWSHGLISDSTYELFNKVCNYSEIRRHATNGDLSPDCSRVNSLYNKEIGNYIDTYDVTADVCFTPPGSASQALYLMGRNTDEKLDGTLDVCVMEETAAYLNRKQVQMALNAKLLGVDGWGFCTRVVRYNLQDLEVSTIPLLGSLVKSGIHVLVYSGDQDSVIPLIGTRILVNQLANDMKLNTTIPYQSWLLGRQVGGWTQVYGDILSFATIRGAAHEAPYSQPERSLFLFSKFLHGKPLTSTQKE